MIDPTPTVPGPLSDDNVHELETLAEAAAGLPWRVADSLPSHSLRTASGTEIAWLTWPDRRDFLDLIAAAVNALPRLLADRQRLTAERAKAVHLADVRLNIINAYENPNLAANYAQVRAQRDELREKVRQANAYVAEARAELARFEGNAEILSCSTIGEAFDRIEQTIAERDAARAFADELHRANDGMGKALDQARAELEAARQRIDAVRRLHIPIHDLGCAPCATCSSKSRRVPWPCPTVLALAEAEEPPASAQPTPEAEEPERTCARCGGPNITWCAPSPLWNQVMRGGSINGDDLHDGMVCPICFAQLAEQAGIAEMWRLYAERLHVPLETITPSGRVWDETTWLWSEPTPETEESLSDHPATRAKQLARQLATPGVTQDTGPDENGEAKS